MKFAWTFDKAGQILRSPGGYKVTVEQIAVTLQDKVNGRHDLSGAWAGWKIRGKTLIAPGGNKYTPELLKEI